MRNEKLKRLALGMVLKPNRERNGKAQTRLTAFVRVGQTETVQKASLRARYNRGKALAKHGHKFLRVHTDACCYCGQYATEGDHRPSLFACENGAKPCSLIGACRECNKMLGTTGRTKPSELITYVMIRRSMTDDWQIKQMIAASAGFETMAEWALSEYMRNKSAERAKERARAKENDCEPVRYASSEMRLPYKD